MSAGVLLIWLVTVIVALVGLGVFAGVLLSTLRLRRALKVIDEDEDEG